MSCTCACYVTPPRTRGGTWTLLSNVNRLTLHKLKGRGYCAKIRFGRVVKINEWLGQVRYRTGLDRWMPHWNATYKEMVDVDFASRTWHYNILCLRLLYSFAEKSIQNSRSTIVQIQSILVQYCIPSAYLHLHLLYSYAEKSITKSRSTKCRYRAYSYSTVAGSEIGTVYVSHGLYDKIRCVFL